jgi:hypothetical protein
MRRIAVIAMFVAASCGPSIKNNGSGTDGGASGPCSTEGATRACYDGPAGTSGVGPCSGGTQTCQGGTWSACAGEVVPTGEVCGNGVDDNCNGMTDEDVDADGDGFTTCGGDCCDSTNDGCGNPALVNPGAFDAPGNMVDDDCDGMVDEGTTACDTGLTSNTTSAMDFAKAMELCDTATMADKKWGVIEAKFLQPDGNALPSASNVQHAIRPGFGMTTVRAGASFAVLSTGHAAATGQTSPSFAAFQGGQSLGQTSGMPSDWIGANGGTPPNASGCPAPDGGTTANDPIMLQLKIRVPTNAQSFKLAANFMSSEYPEWVCSAFNDFFVVLLDSAWTGSPANPTDKNLATYTSPSMQIYPVGVNLAYGDTGLFQQCTNGQTGCATNSGAVPGNITTCAGTSELVGTGMDTTNPGPEYPGDPGYCGTNNQTGGGTGWLVTSGNVKGGEIITLRIAIWDTSDGYYDSVSLIDNFQWSLDTSTPGTVVF